MNDFLLVGLGTGLLVVILLICGLFFAREGIRRWLYSRFDNKLARHSVLIERLSLASKAEFETALAQAAAIEKVALREAILDAALDRLRRRLKQVAELEPENRSDDATVERNTVDRFVRSYEELGIVDRHLARLEESNSWQARAAAAERLGQIGSFLSVPPLLAVIQNVKNEDDDVRGAAFRALGRIRDPRALPRLIEALDYAESSLPPRIAEIIVMYGEVAVPSLIEEIRRAESDVRRMWAAEILGWIGDARAAVPLMDVLGDVSPEVRAKAAGSLGKICDARAVDRLLEMLLSDPIAFVRTRVAQALGGIGHHKVIDHLIHSLNDSEWWVRVRAIEALEQIGKGATAALIVALEDDDLEVRRRAAMALERMGQVDDYINAFAEDGYRGDVHRILLLIGQAGVTEVICDSLLRTEGETLVCLVRLAGDVRDPAAGPMLQELLGQDPDARLASRIIDALGRLGFHQAAPEIVACLRHDDSWVRRSAVEALAQLSADEHRDALLSLSRDPNPDTRRAVCQVLGHVDDDEVRETIRDLLSDPAPTVRSEALRAVAEQEDVDLLERTEGLLFDPAVEVRIEAARVLVVIGDRDSVAGILRAAADAPSRGVTVLAEAFAACFQGGFSELRALAPEHPTTGQVRVLLRGIATRSSEDGSDDAERLAFVDKFLDHEQPMVRRDAVSALASFDADLIDSLLVETSTDPNSAVRQATATVIALRSVVGALHALAERVCDPQPSVRLQVALAFAILDTKVSRKVLLELCEDGHDLVRAGAALGVALRNDPDRFAVLQPHLLDEGVRRAAHEIFTPDSSNPLVRAALAAAEQRDRIETRLFVSRSPVALEKEMVDLARNSLDVDERLQALEICKAIAAGESYTVALGILKNDPAPEVRSRALDLIVGMRCDAEVAGIVGSVLSDPHPALRIQAAEKLQEFDFPEAIEALVHSLDSTDRQLRETVTTSLSVHLRRDPQRAQQLMEEIVSSKPKKIGMVWLLGKSRTAGAMKALMAYQADPDVDVRAAAVGALSRYRVGVVARSLRKSLSDPSGHVRAAAVNALAGLKSAGGQETMRAMLEDPDSFVRQRAALALVGMNATEAEKSVLALRTEPEELKSVWAAGGVVRGTISPDEARAFTDVPRFLEQLFSLERAHASASSSPDPAERLVAFRVMQVLDPTAAIDVARSLTTDPAPDLREEADRLLLSSGVKLGPRAQEAA